MFALNQGEVCTCPSRALIPRSASTRTSSRRRRNGPAPSSKSNPLDTDTTDRVPRPPMTSSKKIMSYVDIGKKEGAKVVLGGSTCRNSPGDLKGGYYFQPTILEGNNRMRVFQEEIFRARGRRDLFQGRGRRSGDRQTIRFTAGAGVWSRDGNTAFRMGRAIQAGTRLDELLSPVSRARGVRRIQAIRDRPQKPTA